MSRAVLNDYVYWLQFTSDAIVVFKNNRSGKDNHIIERRRSMHSRIFRLECLRQSGNLPARIWLLPSSQISQSWMNISDQASGLAPHWSAENWPALTSVT